MTNPAPRGETHTRRPGRLEVIRHGLTALAILCFFDQLLLAQRMDNALAAFLALCTTIVSVQYCLRPGMLSGFPISAIMLLGLAVCTSGGSLLALSFYHRPLVYNLSVPVRTLALSAGYTFVGVATHVCYRYSRTMWGLRQHLTMRVYRPLGMFAAPANATLWLMGGVGMAAAWASGTSEASANIEFGDVFGKILQGLIPFAGAPLIIPIAPKLFAHSTRPVPQTTLLSVLAYFGLLLGLALATNSRATFSVALLTAGLCWTLALLGERTLPSKATIAIWVAALAIAPIAYAGLARISTAIVIARSERTELSASELIQHTLAIARNDNLIEARNLRDGLLTSGYNEVYIPNRFLARLVMTKYIDLNLTHAMALSESNIGEVRALAIQRLIAGLPTPVIKFFGIDVDKNSLKFTSGDVYRFFAARGPLGQNITGSSLVDGLVLLGPFFWILAPLYLVLCFTIFDALAVRSEDRTIISAFAGLQMSFFFSQALQFESIAGQAVTILRAIPQDVAIYVALALLGRFLFGSPSRHRDYLSA
jgi:hypothetical protein